MSKYVDNGLLMDRKDRIEAKNSPMRFLYDRYEKTIFGRTALGWAQMISFYLIFYAVLSAIFAFYMWVCFQTIDSRMPKWKLGESIIGSNPGLGFRPIPASWIVGSTLIWYNGSDRESYKDLVENASEFLEPYRTPSLTPGREQNIYNCNYDKPPGSGQVCHVDVKNWDPCIIEKNFSYPNASPCFFIKLNKIYGWVPEYYNSTSGLPKSMPAALKNHIANISLTKPHELNTVWVTCEGEHAVDNENLGPINYIPRQGFPGYFFPYENSEGYLSPIVAVHVVKPKRGVIINIECKAWAKNIEHGRQDRLGSAHIELLID